jgi:hypothetical protein
MSSVFHYFVLLLFSKNEGIGLTLVYPTYLPAPKMQTHHNLALYVHFPFVPSFLSKRWDVRTIQHEGAHQPFLTFSAL